MATAMVEVESCTICNQPSVKYNPLKECAMCKKLVHKRCTRLIAGTASMHCNNCLTEKQKEEKEKRKSMNKSTPQARLLTSKGTSQRYSSSSESNAISKHKTAIHIGKKTTTLNTDVTTSKKKTSCDCFEAFQHKFDEWGKLMQDQHELFYDKIKNMITDVFSTFHKNFNSLTNATSEKIQNRPPSMTATSTSSQSTSDVSCNISTNDNCSKNKFAIETNNNINNKHFNPLIKK